MKMVLASKNPKKLEEMVVILSQLGIEVVLESDVGVDVEVEETGTTFEENAALKAFAVMEAAGLPAIADDSGLCVDALNGAPGVHSARYADDEGDGHDDKANNRKLLRELAGVLFRAGFGGGQGLHRRFIRDHSFLSGHSLLLLLFWFG